MTEGDINISHNSINNVQPQTSGMVIMTSISEPVIYSTQPQTFKIIPNTYTTISQSPKLIQNEVGNYTYVVKTAPPTTYILNRMQTQAPTKNGTNGIPSFYQPPPPLPLVRLRPGPIVVRPPPVKQLTIHRPVSRPPLIRVIQPVNLISNTIRLGKSPVKPTTKDVPVRKESVTYSRVKDYPGDPSEIFESTLEKPARLATINWKKFREEYTAKVNLSEAQSNGVTKSPEKILKPWDTKYHPTPSNLRPVKTPYRGYCRDTAMSAIRQASSISLNSNMVRVGPLMEKNLLGDFKKKPKRRRRTASCRSDDTPNTITVVEPRKNIDPVDSVVLVKPNEESNSISLVEPGKVRDLCVNIKEEWYDNENFNSNTNLESCDDSMSPPRKKVKRFKPRTRKGEFLLTLAKKKLLSREDLVYFQIAANSMLDKAHDSMDNLDPSLKPLINIENLYESLKVKPVDDKGFVDRKTKIMDFKNALGYSVRKAISNAAEVRKFKRPKPLHDGRVLYYDDPEIEEMIPNESGCARLEPFTKRVFIPNSDTDGRQFITITEDDEKAAKSVTERTKQERHMMRHMLTVYQGEVPDIAKNDLFKSHGYNGNNLVKHAKSPIHGSGLFALQDIEENQLIIEYVGEQIRHSVADMREKNYEKQGIGGSYMFRLDNEWVIDATKRGNMARFINHCCQPNCYARIVSRDRIKRIFIFSKFVIQKGEEITYNYNFEFEDDNKKIRCHCGAKQCRNYLN